MSSEDFGLREPGGRVTAPHPLPGEPTAKDARASWGEDGIVTGHPRSSSPPRTPPHRHGQAMNAGRPHAVHDDTEHRSRPMTAPSPLIVGVQRDRLLTGAT